MLMSRSTTRWAGVVALAVTAALSSAGAAAASGQTAGRAAAATGPAQPVGLNAINFTGNGFDACSAPSEAQMAAWRASSPYDAIGIYIGGANRACAQPNLTPQWVHDELAAGWHFFLLYTGPQVPGSVCTTCTTITDPEYDAADAADDAVKQAAALGFQPGTPIFYDFDDYSSGGETTVTALQFVGNWNSDLARFGFRGGVHGGMGSIVKDLTASSTSTPTNTYLDFASGDGQQSTDDPSIPATFWSNHQRVNQYAAAHAETWGGVTLTVGSDYLDLQTSSAPAFQNMYAIAPDGSVQALQFSDETPVWFSIGGDATDVYVTPNRVFASFADNRGVFEYSPVTAAWTRIGGPGARFATVGDTLYGLTPDRSHVYRWDGTDGVNSWTAVGNAASAIYGGGFGLVATTPSNSSLYLYSSASSGAPMTWQRIGGGGSEYAETSNTLFGLTADRSAVYQWSGKGTAWTRIGGAAQNIYAPADGLGSNGELAASTPGNANLYVYGTGGWSHIGQAGAGWAFCDSIFGLGAIDGPAYEYWGPNDYGPPWWPLGGSFTSLHCVGTA